jgi:cation diffusion facilitator CzcD-associated flavoprotein CzcO
VQSHLYSFSFAPNPSWSRMFAPQSEIRDYLERCATDFGLRSRIRFHENVERAEFDETSRTWVVRTSTGGTYRARSVVSAMGALSNPAYPDLPGLDRFQGRSFHSAYWDHDYDFAGKRVAVVGTGASAIQFVPKIAGQVRRLDLYQRSAPWVLSKPDRAVTPLERWLFRALPFVQSLYRFVIYWMLEARVLGFVNPRLMQRFESVARRHLQKQVKDPVLREKLTPRFTIGCKRILMSDDYYPALCRENVDVIVEGIREVREHSIVTADGREREVDAIVFGTGFTVQELARPGMFFGAGGRDLAKVWAGSPEAYKGTTVAGFPNLFFLAGPNTGLGHSSMVHMIESQVTYVVQALRAMHDGRVLSLEVRQDVQDAYNARIQAKYQGSVWQSGCKSWYLSEDGKNTTLWPSFTFRFRMETAHFRSSDYRIVHESTNVPAGPARLSAAAAQSAGA